VRSFNIAQFKSDYIKVCFFLGGPHLPRRQRPLLLLRSHHLGRPDADLRPCQLVHAPLDWNPSYTKARSVFIDLQIRRDKILQGQTSALRSRGHLGRVRRNKG